MDILVLAAAIVTMACKQVIELLTENGAGLRKQNTFNFNITWRRLPFSIVILVDSLDIL